eukprot:3592277-Pleurochrysis_carterae.AAC.1
MSAMLWVGSWGLNLRRVRKEGGTLRAHQSGVHATSSAAVHAGVLPPQVCWVRSSWSRGQQDHDSQWRADLELAVLRQRRGSLSRPVLSILRRFAAWIHEAMGQVAVLGHGTRAAERNHCCSGASTHDDHQSRLDWSAPQLRRHLHSNYHFVDARLD